MVLDEADEMLRMGFIEEVEQILQYTPAEKQVALFSATLPQAIQRVEDFDAMLVFVRTKVATAELAERLEQWVSKNEVPYLEGLRRFVEV